MKRCFRCGKRLHFWVRRKLVVRDDEVRKVQTAEQFVWQFVCDSCYAQVQVDLRFILGLPRSGHCARTDIAASRKAQTMNKCHNCGKDFPDDYVFDLSITDIPHGFTQELLCKECSDKRLDPQAAPGKRPKSDFSGTAEKETDEIRIKSNLAQEIEIQMSAHLKRLRRESSASGIPHSFLKHLDLLRNLDSTAYVVNTIVTQMKQLEGKHNHILTDWRKFAQIIISVSSISASPLEARYLFPRGYLHHLEDLFRQCAYTELDLSFANWVCTWTMAERKIHLSVFPRYKATGDEKQVILACELMTEAQRAYMGGRIIS